MPEPTAKPRIYTSAFFCQDVLREKDSDVLTAIRISDAFTVLPAEFTLESGKESAVTKSFYLPLMVHALLRFHSDGPTDFEVRLKGIDPDGVEMKPMGAPFRCKSKGGTAGHSLNIKLTIGTGKEGDYRLEVYVDGGLATTMPLRIIHGIAVEAHQPDQTSGQPATASE
jgi:hypothetical protein